LTKSNASREHTVPKWLEAELGITHASVEPTLTSVEGVQLEQRVHPVNQLLTGSVCRNCNSGWMSLLESEVQPILRALIHPKRSIESLRKAERHAVARWAMKTAFVLDRGGFEPRVSLRQVEELFTNAPYLPKDVYVFARQQTRTRPWYYDESAWWKHAPLTDAAAGRVAADSYKIALQFGDLILLVVHWPLSGWGIRVEKDELIKLWPSAAIVKQYIHPAPMDSSTSDLACLRHSTTISVVPKRNAEGLVPG
jgi:hypothetical protein